MLDTGTNCMLREGTVHYRKWELAQGTSERPISQLKTYL